MNVEGYYRARVTPVGELYDWLRFYDDGLVLLARTGGRVETLVTWFGRPDVPQSNFADGQGRYSRTGHHLTLTLADAHQTLTYEATLQGDGLRLRPADGSGAPARLFVFVPEPDHIAVETHPVSKEEQVALPPVLPPFALAWWRFASGRGWQCRRCGKVPLHEERECWLDTGCCTECAIEDGR